MKRTVVAFITPPIAVFHYGAASPTAAPIAVFWLAGLVGIFYGLTGGVLDSESISWPEMLLGLITWLIAGVWARFVIQGVEHDLAHDADSTLDHQIKPDPDEKDPLKEVENV